MTPRNLNIEPPERRFDALIGEKLFDRLRFPLLPWLVVARSKVLCGKSYQYLVLVTRLRSTGNPDPLLVRTTCLWY